MWLMMSSPVDWHVSIAGMSWKMLTNIDARMFKLEGDMSNSLMSRDWWFVHMLINVSITGMSGKISTKLNAHMFYIKGDMTIFMSHDWWHHHFLTDMCHLYLCQGRCWQCLMFLCYKHKKLWAIFYSHNQWRHIVWLI